MAVKHPLHHFFLELTLNCNLNCLHCGSHCSRERKHGDELSKDEWKALLDHVKENFDLKDIILEITGGEPLMNPDFFEIMEYARDLGYHWGMTTNATLITKEVAEKLEKAGMREVAVSIDGLPSTHDAFRQTLGAYDLAMRGLQNLIDRHAFGNIMVTTVVHKKNLHELEDLYQILLGLDIDTWRVMSIEPMGSALMNKEYMLEGDEYRQVLDFIKAKRDLNMPVTYGCCHFLGVEYEAEVREWIYRCIAGTRVASVAADGSIGACLDIERRPETIQGNVRTDSFTEVWNNRFEIFRQPKYPKTKTCQACQYKEFCDAGPYHSFNYDTNEPRLCMLKEIGGL